MSPTATTKTGAPRPRAAPAGRCPAATPGKLLRVNLTHRARSGPSPGAPTRCATDLGGVGPRRPHPLRRGRAEGALGPSGEPADPGHRTARGAAGVGDGRAHRGHARRPDRRRDVDAGQRLLRRLPQVLGLRRHRRPGAGEDARRTSTSTTTWSRSGTPRTSRARTRGRRSRRSRREHGLSGHRMSVYAHRARPARTWCASPPSTATTATSRRRTAAARSWARSGSRRCASCAGPRRSPPTTRAGWSRPPTTSPTTSRPIRRPSTLYRWGTLPGVSNLYKLGVAPDQELHDEPHHRGHGGVGADRSCATASTTAGTSATPAACTTATSR